MVRNNRKTLIITSIITLLPILIGILYWDRLPDSMATHFGMDNQANGYSGKVFAIFGLPLLLLVAQWFCAFLTANDPRRKNISSKMFTLVLWIIPVVSLLSAATMYPYNLGMRPDITFYAELFMGVLFIIVGNFLPKARQNYTIGIRAPWTLANEENWNRTHRFAGFLWIGGGILMVLMTLLGVRRIEVFLVILFVISLVPLGYSFWLHAKRGL
ncbi:MAG: SdpI family protein [Lachnospiraceae bacterium]|nr:SdpI family protein [Lachnospiraceae bacterium]